MRLKSHEYLCVQLNIDVKKYDFVYVVCHVLICLCDIFVISGFYLFSDVMHDDVSSRCVTNDSLEMQQKHLLW